MKKYHVCFELNYSDADSPQGDKPAIYIAIISELMMYFQNSFDLEYPMGGTVYQCLSILGLAV